MEYTWLSEYQRTWEEANVLKEDIAVKKKEGQYLRPILRRMILVLDYSKMALKKDFRPSRYKIISKYAEKFWDLFYSCNPLSKLQVLVCKNGKAFVAEKKEELAWTAEGEFSLQNALEVALMLLNESGPHWSNEVLVILNSLNTCDYGDIWPNLAKLQSNYVRINAISTCAQSNIIKRFIDETGGKSIVVQNEDSLKENWDDFAKSGFPAPSAALIPMAFPVSDPFRTPCACHYEMREGFICSVCRSKVCEIPRQCPVCKNFLVSVPHLTKASLSIKPLPPFIDLQVELNGFAGLQRNCEGCQEEGQYACQVCHSVYCETCKEFLQSNLGKCIGCSFD